MSCLRDTQPLRVLLWEQTGGELKPTRLDSLILVGCGPPQNPLGMHWG